MENKMRNDILDLFDSINMEMKGGAFSCIDGVCGSRPKSRKKTKTQATQPTTQATQQTTDDEKIEKFKETQNNLMDHRTKLQDFMDSKEKVHPDFQVALDAINMNIETLDILISKTSSKKDKQSLKIFELLEELKERPKQSPMVRGAIEILETQDKLLDEMTGGRFISPENKHRMTEMAKRAYKSDTGRAFTGAVKETVKQKAYEHLQKKHPKTGKFLDDVNKNYTMGGRSSRRSARRSGRRSARRSGRRSARRSTRRSARRSGRRSARRSTRRTK